jgi:hypothetical protein
VTAIDDENHFELQGDRSRVITYMYSLRSTILFVNTDVPTIRMCLDTSVLAKSNMGPRE